jgi:hypothetical protein
MQSIVSFMVMDCDEFQAQKSGSGMPPFRSAGDNSSKSLTAQAMTERGKHRAWNAISRSSS